MRTVLLMVVAVAAKAAAQVPDFTGTWLLNAGQTFGNLYIQQTTLVGGASITGQLVVQSSFGKLSAPISGGVKLLTGNYYRASIDIFAQMAGGDVTEFSGQAFSSVPTSGSVVTMSGSFGPSGQISLLGSNQWTAQRIATTVPAGATTPTSPAAAGACSAASVIGSYGFTLTGRSGGEFSSVGRMTFDGKGAGAVVETESVDGAVARGRQYPFTYTVASDCTGVISAGNFPLASLDFVVTGQGKTLVMIQADQGATVSGKAELQ